LGLAIFERTCWNLSGFSDPELLVKDDLPCTVGNALAYLTGVFQGKIIRGIAL